MTQTILVIDDDKDVLSAIRLLLKSEGHTVVCADSPAEAMIVLNRQSVDLTITDLNFSLDTTSGEEGLSLIQKIRANHETLPIVVMTGWGTIEVAVESMKNGANDFFQKPWENQRLLSIVENQLKYGEALKTSKTLSEKNTLLKKALDGNSVVIAESAAMKEVVALVERVAKSDASVLITGENGTGKSLLAKFIHNHSNRHHEDIVSVNMGAVTESLFESEMFGHLKGALTDAKSTRIGRFELANSSTLFLDEIANTPYSQQGKLLRVLEDSQFEKVGSSQTQTVDVRLVAATNADLDTMIEEGSFRKDLFFRINTFEIKIPALRERKEDIIPLAKNFLQNISAKQNTDCPKLSPQAEALLVSYDWPGNVRELSHVMERAQILCMNNLIQADDLFIQAPAIKSQIDEKDSCAIVPDTTGSTRNDSTLDASIHRTLEDIENDLINIRLAYFDGNVLEAAKSLGLSRSAFYRRLEKIKENQLN